MSRAVGRKSAKILFPSLLAILALLAAACGGGSDEAGGSGTEHSAETPPLEFTVNRLTSYSTASGHEEKEKSSAANQAGDQLAVVMKDLYSAAFLDPENWKNGEYSSAGDLFDGNAAKTAPGDEAILTAGADAGSTYSDIQPEFTHLNVKVLTDEKGQPKTAVAIAEFEATATETGGGSTTLVSHGQYFMNRLNGKNWTIFAYDVERLDGAPLTVVGPPKNNGSDDAKDKDKQPKDEGSDETEGAA